MYCFLHDPSPSCLQYLIFFVRVTYSTQSNSLGCTDLKIIVSPLLTSVTQKNVPSAVVYCYCAWYVFLRDRRYKPTAHTETCRRLLWIGNKMSNFQFSSDLRPDLKQFSIKTIKVQLFWEGHKNFGVIFFHLFWHLLSKSVDLSKQLEDNGKILWSSQKSWTLILIRKKF